MTLDQAAVDTHTIDVPKRRRIPRPQVDATPEPIADSAYLHGAIGHYGRLLWDIQRLRIAIGNRIKAMERDNIPEHWIAPAREQLRNLEQVERSVGRMLETTAGRHFLAEWVIGQRGIGLGGFARLLAVTGPLDRFGTVSKLWKFLGQAVQEGPQLTHEEALALCIGDQVLVKVPAATKTYDEWRPGTVKDSWADATDTVKFTFENIPGEFCEFDLYHFGKAQRMPAGQLASHSYCAGGTHLRTCPPDCARDHHPNCHPDQVGNAYSPQGKVVCRQIADAIVKVGAGGPYRLAYDRKKAYYQNNRPNWSKKHCHEAAMRYAVKGLLRDMWQAWMEAMPANG